MIRFKDPFSAVAKHCARSGRTALRPLCDADLRQARTIRGSLRAARRA